MTVSRNRATASSLGAILSTLCFVPTAVGLELSGSVTACHDPSRIVEFSGRYYVYSTAPNINLRSSADLVNWRWEPQLFSFPAGIPSWMAAIGAGDNLWAPDVVGSTAAGGYLAYYSRNLGSGATERSVCGVATATSAGGPWTDQGSVLDVTVGSDYYRVIDPAPIFDQTGQLWLAVGSFGFSSGNGLAQGGIRIFKINAQTGKLASAVDPGTRLAGSWIEAPYLHYHDGFFYLFFNQAVCCAGLKSTYYIRVGRSAAITGPFADADGGPLLTANVNGTLFMGRHFESNFSGTDTAPVPLANCGSVGREIGPGHVGIGGDSDGIERVSYHYYDGNTNNGEPTLGIKTIVWGAGGWPRPGWSLPDGIYAIGSRLNANPETNTALWLDASNGVPRLAAWTGLTSQLWDFKRVDANRYTVTSRDGSQNLAIVGSDVAGDKKPIGMASADASNTSQRWFVEQTNDTSFRMLNVGTSKCLQVAGTKAVAGAGLETFSYGINLPEQRWFITPAGAFRIRALHSSLYLNAAGTTATSNVDQRGRTDTQAQVWWFVPMPDGHTKIVNAQTGLALTVEGGSKSNAARVRQDTDNGNDAQRWSVDVLTDGSVRFVPKVSGKALEVAGAATNTGALVQQGNWTHVLNQQFGIETVSAIAAGGTSSTGGSNGSGGAVLGGTGGTAVVIAGTGGSSVGAAGRTATGTAAGGGSALGGAMIGGASNGGSSDSSGTIMAANGGVKVTNTPGAGGTTAALSGTIFAGASAKGGTSTGETSATTGWNDAGAAGVTRGTQRDASAGSKESPSGGCNCNTSTRHRSPWSLLAALSFALGLRRRRRQQL